MYLERNKERIAIYDTPLLLFQHKININPIYLKHMSLYCHTFVFTIYYPLQTCGYTFYSPAPKNVPKQIKQAIALGRIIISLLQKSNFLNTLRNSALACLICG